MPSILGHRSASSARIRGGDSVIGRHQLAYSSPNCLGCTCGQHGFRSANSVSHWPGAVSRYQSALFSDTAPSIHMLARPLYMRSNYFYHLILQGHNIVSSISQERRRLIHTRQSAYQLFNPW